MSLRYRRIGGCFLSAISIGVAAQSLAAEPQPQSRCEKDVRDYLQAMSFVRTTAGSAIGDRVAASLAGEETVRKIASQQGQCAAAVYIRERTTKR